MNKKEKLIWIGIVIATSLTVGISVGRFLTN